MIDKKNIKVGDLQFNCRVTGNKNNELVLFLHGFPETSHMWHNLMPEIAKLGFYCVAPNLRGFSPEARPKGKKHYDIDLLVSDVIGISKTINHNKFHLIGHDWGAGIGWKTAHDYPEHILSFSALSVPHLQAFGNAIITDKEQRKMSVYIRLFQWPFFPELKIKQGDFKLLKSFWDIHTQEEINNYISVFKQKNALTAALNYYRANYKRLKLATKEEILGVITTPTLFIWGKNDIAIGKTAVENSHKYITADYKYIELNAGHWLIQEKFNEVKSAIIEQLLKYKST